MALTRPKYSQIYDTDWKNSVKLATTADVGDLLNSNVQPNSVDGVSLTINDRILVKDQGNTKQNGLYFVRTVGTGANGWWVRTLDANQDAFVTGGLTVDVTNGNTNSNKTYRLTTPDPIYLGNTALTFGIVTAQPGGANTYVQFYDQNNQLNGVSGFTFDKTSNLVTVSGNINATTYLGNLAPAAGLTNVVITGNLIPSANAVYNLGSPTARWKTGYLTAATLDLDGSTISVDPTNGFKFTVSGSTTPTYLSSNGALSGASLTTSGNITATSGWLNVGTINTIGNILSTSATFSAANVNGSLATTGITTLTNSTNATGGASGALQVTGGAYIAKDLWVIGNIYAGNLMSTVANVLTTQNSLLYLQNSNTYPYSYSIGMYGHYIGGPANAYVHTGMVRQPNDNTWWFISNIAEPSPATANLNVYDSNRILDNIQAGNINLVGNIIAATHVGSNVFVNGNVTANYLLGSGQFLTGLPASYSNVQVATYLPTYTGNITAGNLIISTGAGQFNGPFLESSTSAGVYVGNAGSGTPSPRIGVFNGTASQNWQIDNYFGTFRWFTPGATRMSLDPNGNLQVTGALIAGGSAGTAGQVLQSTATGIQWTAPSAGTQVSSGTSNVAVLSSGGNVVISVGGAIIANVGSTGLTVMGSVSSGSFVGDGSRLTGLPAGYSNVNAATYLVSGLLTTAINTTGNILSTGAIHNALTVNGISSLTGNTSHGTAGAISGQFHTFVGNITQTTSGGAVYINTTGNISASIGNFGTINAAAGALSGITALTPSGNTTTTLGSLTAQWGTIYGAAVTAKYADLAEIYTSDKKYVPGTVLIFGGDKEVTISTISHDPRIAGVVSTDPAYLMNSSETGVAVALTGRVPCQVLGPVTKGDRLVASQWPGIAQKLNPSLYEPGCVIGKALETFEESSVKTIEVVVGRV